MTSLFKEFFQFLKKFGIVAVAIGIVIGAASTAVINALVVDIINPFVGLFLPQGDLSNLSVKVYNIFGKITEFRYGDLISQMINFVIIAIVIFLMYKLLKKYKIIQQEQDDKK